MQCALLLLFVESVVLQQSSLGTVLWESEREVSFKNVQVVQGVSFFTADAADDDDDDDDEDAGPQVPLCLLCIVT